jgi:SpoVK/Ycf46/Vps4 family AAA+-type ATPase
MVFNLIYYSNDRPFNGVLDYIYHKHSDKIHNFTVKGETTFPRYDYRWRKDQSKRSLKNIVPQDSKFKISEEFENEACEVWITLETLIKDGKIQTVFTNPDGCGGEDILLKKLTITCENRELLMKLMERAKTYAKEKVKLIESSTNSTVTINYYKKEYWSQISKIPKRPIDTLFLKENVKEKMISFVEEFCNEDTREVYMKHGIPYKCVVLIYGPPGTGKTSTITSIASAIDSDIYIVPMFKELTDYTLVDALSGVRDRDDDDRKSIIVLEDIDTIFDTRKEGDDNNMLTLNGLLNALDGHTCPEGSLIFMTANNPQVFDSALIRSCRVDYKLHLDYIDEYQIKNMYESFFPEQMDKFPKFYNMICGKQITTAMLQEFFFYNRKSENIVSDVSKLNEIIEKNDPKNFEKEKKNMYC